MSDIRIIVLTSRNPVRIEESQWPIIASARDEDWDGEFEFQANRISKWFVGVRRHADGRKIVYATYDHTNNWQNSRQYSARRGVLLPADSTDERVCEAISEVCNGIATAQHAEDDASRWYELLHECVADMPAVTL